MLLESEIMLPAKAEVQTEQDLIETIQINELKFKSQRNIIAVDSREFSSMTPVFLHQAGFWVIPM